MPGIFKQAFFELCTYFVKLWILNEELASVNVHCSMNNIKQ